MTYFADEAKWDEQSAREATALVTAMQRDLKKLSALVMDEGALGAIEAAESMLIEARQRALAVLGAITYEKPKKTSKK